jgi:hypothetical protein
MRDLGAIKCPTKERITTVTAFVTIGFPLDDAEIDWELIKANRGTVALPFKPGK